MDDRNLPEMGGIWSRAWRESDLHVILFLALVGGALAWFLLGKAVELEWFDEKVNFNDEALYIVIPVAGAMLAGLLLFAVKLTRAPFKQRDEAREAVIRLTASPEYILNMAKRDAGVILTAGNAIAGRADSEESDYVQWWMDVQGFVSDSSQAGDTAHNWRGLEAGSFSATLVYLMDKDETVQILRNTREGVRRGVEALRQYRDRDLPERLHPNYLRRRLSRPYGQD